MRKALWRSAAAADNNSLNRHHAIAARLNRLPPIRTHYYATAVVGVGAFFDLFDIFLAGVLGTVLTQEFGLDRLSLPAALSSAFLGMFVGATALGRFADRYGRRTAFMLNLGIYSGFTLAGAFSTNATTLIVSRFLAGVGIGAELPLVDAYLSELLPSRLRGRYTAWAYTLGFVGIPAAGLLGRVLVPLEPFGVDGWRWLFVIGSLGALIVWLLRSRLPESPRWLASVGRDLEADAIVTRMEQEANIHSAIATGPAEAGPHVQDPNPPDSVAIVQPRWLATFSGAYRPRVIMLGVFHIFQTIGYYGFGTLAPLVLASKGYSIVTSLTFTTLTFIGYPIGSALSIPIVERVDRKWLIVASAFLMSVLGIGMGYAASPVAIVTLGFLYTAASNVFSNGLHVFQAEIFPTAVRTTAAGACYGLSRLSSAAMPFVLLPVLRQWGPGPMFVVVGAAMWIVMIDVGWFGPRTTGLSLEEVNKS
ncbi:MAG TPA: MFS transporter [Vicinamibacterales bacterium]|nr:MFS transporter [Vicinamibacterales bacterium]